MMVPGVDRTLLLVHFALEVTQRSDIVERMDIAGDDVGERANLGPRDRIFRQQRRIGLRLLKIFDDGERLDQHVAGRRDERLVCASAGSPRGIQAAGCARHP